jgi:hypothetical protein
MTSANETERRGGRAPVFALLLTLLLFVLCCGGTTTDPTGGETHFLRVCDPLGTDCGAGLVCLCGVCSVSCGAGATCESYASAQCLPASAAACPDAADTSYCDVSCSVSSDCAAISPAHYCEQGRCRAPASDCQSGGTRAEQVVLLGDSFFATGMQQVSADLEALARGAGVLGADEHYRDNSSLAQCSLAFDGGIADQYTLAAQAPVKVVIMNGGGVDALVGACATVSPDCPWLGDAAAAAAALFERMADDGVERVVYAFYPDPLDPTLRDKIDALRPLLRDACAASPVACTFVDLRPAFEGHYDAYIMSDGINPNADGAQAAAQAIWSSMKASCIAQ